MGMVLSPRASLKAVRISPLVGAILSSNWVLFRKVYDTYEQWTEERWSREQVRNACTRA